MRVFRLLVLISFFSIVTATTFKELSMANMLEQSQIAFHGEVISSEVIDKQGEPWTKVKFKILKALLGLKNQKEVSLLFFGGYLDGKSVSVSLMPQFYESEKVIILAYKQEYYSPIVGFNQGLWREQTLGLVDENGHVLSLEDGELVLNGEGAATNNVLQAFEKAFEGKK